MHVTLLQAAKACVCRRAPGYRTDRDAPLLDIGKKTVEKKSFGGTRELGGKETFAVVRSQLGAEHL
ncbi:MAG: hypothetical protein JO308_09085 [Verrucomicrobia bacterium]|nr:hypothetical protein [Verrucomicrobiota bacterium]